MILTRLRVTVPSSDTALNVVGHPSVSEGSRSIKSTHHEEKVVFKETCALFFKVQRTVWVTVLSLGDQPDLLP